MYLTGTQAADPIGYAITTLKSTFEAGLRAAPWTGKFAPYGGLWVTDDVVEATSWLRSKRCHIFMEPGACSEDSSINFRRVVGGQARAGARWNIAIEMDIVVSTYAARMEPLAIAAAKDIVKRNYVALRDLGLEGSNIVAADANQQEGRICPHTFTCDVHLIY